MENILSYRVHERAVIKAYKT